MEKNEKSLIKKPELFQNGKMGTLMDRVKPAFSLGEKAWRELHVSSRRDEH